MKASEVRAMIQRHQTEATVASLALNDLANGSVKWFGNSREYSLGICRPSCASGGIVIVRHCGTTASYYWESFARDALAHIAACITGHETEANRELLRRRAAIESAQAYVSESLKAA